MRDIYGWVINLLVSDLERKEYFCFTDTAYLWAKSIERIRLQSFCWLLGHGEFE